MFRTPPTIPNPPMFAIGALGGSGTRMVAQLFRERGIHIGHQLNHANDSLDFTQLIVNAKNIQEPPFELFAAYMSNTHLSLDMHQKLWSQLLTRWLIEQIKMRHIEAHWRWQLHPFLRQQWMHLNTPPTPLQSWGWKEPNTHIFLPEILTLFPTLRYIHVIRHGFDMAFSNNHNQLCRWGERFGINISRTAPEAEIASAQLDYWIRSTQRITELQDVFPGRILILKVEDFWQDTTATITRCLTHANIPHTPADITALSALPKRPATMQRYASRDMSCFRPDQWDAVQQQGYQIHS